VNIYDIDNTKLNFGYVSHIQHIYIKIEYE